MQEHRNPSQHIPIYKKICITRCSEDSTAINKPTTKQNSFRKVNQIKVENRDNNFSNALSNRSLISNVCSNITTSNTPAANINFLLTSNQNKNLFSEYAKRFQSKTTSCLNKSKDNNNLNINTSKNSSNSLVKISEKVNYEDKYDSCNYCNEDININEINEEDININIQKNTINFSLNSRIINNEENDVINTLNNNINNDDNKNVFDDKTISFNNANNNRDDISNHSQKNQEKSFFNSDDSKEVDNEDSIISSNLNKETKSNTYILNNSYSKNTKLIDNAEATNINETNDMNFINAIDEEMASNEGNFNPLDNMQKSIEELEIEDIIKTIAEIIDDICINNKSENNKENKAELLHQRNSLFFSANIPKISVENYLTRIAKYTKIEKSTIILASMYVDVYCNKQSFHLTYNTVYR